MRTFVSHASELSYATFLSRSSNQIEAAIRTSAYRVVFTIAAFCLFLATYACSHAQNTHSYTHLYAQI